MGVHLEYLQSLIIAQVFRCAVKINLCQSESEPLGKKSVPPPEQKRMICDGDSKI